MKKIALALFIFTSLSSSHADVRLDYGNDSVFLDESSLCAKGDIFYPKKEFVKICLDLRALAKTGRCPNELKVYPSRPARTMERVCIRKTPGKNPGISCAQYALQEVVVPMTYTVTTYDRNYKHPKPPVVKEYTIPQCSF